MNVNSFNKVFNTIFFRGVFQKEKKFFSNYIKKHITIPFIRGDGIGVEITPVAQSVIDLAVWSAYRRDRTITWVEVEAGDVAFRKTGDRLPSEALETIFAHKMALKGPLETPVGEGHESLNVKLRRVFDLYACVRPFNYYPGVPTRFKNLDNLNITVFRENIEDTYGGIEFAQNTDGWHHLMNEVFLKNPKIKVKIPFPKSTSFGIKIASQEGTERLVRSAIDYAIRYKKPSVTIVHKGNIMKLTEGAFQKWGLQVALREYANYVTTNKSSSGDKILVRDLITDNFIHQCKIRPEQFSVVVSMNLTGDLISDDLAGIVGGLGVSPGANINYQTGYGIFEATHGTAPDIVGQNRSNPTSLILSGEMMLRHLGWEEAADKINMAIRLTFQKRIGTGDLFDKDKDATVVDTHTFGKELIKRM